MFEWCEQCEKSETIINNLLRENAELKAKLESLGYPVGPTIAQKTIKSNVRSL